LISLRLTETLITENTGLKPGDKYKILNPMAEANDIAESGCSAKANCNNEANGNYKCNGNKRSFRG